MKKLENASFILDRTIPFSYKDRIKRVLYHLAAISNKIKMNAINANSGDEKEYKVSLCTIFKNEAPYLKEWIEFNHLIGVDHFFLYNNNSDDDYLSVLQPYINRKLVTLIQWPKDQAQLECYDDCIHKFRSMTQWLGFIDVDEFIVPIKTNNIYDFLKQFEKNRGAVKIYWKMFGTSGMINRDLDTLVTERFTVSWPKYYSVGKCFYNTNFEFNFGDKKNSIFHHLFWAEHNGKHIPPVNVFDKVCLNGFDVVKNEPHPIQINHYFTKSYKEYAIKKAKGDVYFKINPHDEEYFYLHEMENTSVDYSAYKYLVQLKFAMNESRNME